MSTAGCGTLYVAQAAAGQWQIVRARRPIPAVIADPTTTPQLRARLVEVRAARDFAVATLHLPDNRSYRTYADIHRPYVVWNVVATPEFSVEPERWCFPVAGCVAYRGYFSRQRAERFAAGLAQAGFDVSVGGVAAYSTLGKFDDPVLNTMMRYGESELIAIIFHELAHQLLYVKNDSEFNEAFATTVEDAGLERWLQAQGHPDRMRAFLAENVDDRAFIELFTDTRRRLRTLYASSVPKDEMRRQKRQILGDLATQMRSLQKRLGVEDYQSWLDEGLNNAQLASIATYYECVPGFERLLAAQGGDLQRFYAAARKLAREPRSERHAALCAAPIHPQASDAREDDQ